MNKELDAFHGLHKEARDDFAESWNRHIDDQELARIREESFTTGYGTALTHLYINDLKDVKAALSKANAEVERLRNALELIAECEWTLGEDSGPTEEAQMAREALSEVRE